MQFQSNVINKEYPGQVVKIFGWAGEPKHEQPSRPDPRNLIDDVTKTFWRGHPFALPVNVAGQLELSFTCVPEGGNVFVIQVMLDGKPYIVERHVDEQGRINWAGVAGENDNAHDHWVNAFGVVTIEDFDVQTDRVIVTGHTVQVSESFMPSKIGPGARRDIYQFGRLQEALSVMVYSQQGGGGGAHDEDLLGIIQFPGAERVIAGLAAIRTTAGVAETWDSFEDLLEFYEELSDKYTNQYDEFAAWMKRAPVDLDSFSDRQQMWLFNDVYRRYVDLERIGRILGLVE